MVVAVTPEINAGMWLPAEHFAVGGIHSAPSVQPNLPQSLRENKTAGLVTLEGLRPMADRGRRPLVTGTAPAETDKEPLWADAGGRRLVRDVGGRGAGSCFAGRFSGESSWSSRWFIARVSLAPTLLVAIPFTVLVSFTLNILLRELGAADLSGAGAAFGAVTQVGPLVTVLIVAGAGATAMCADLGSRTIREEIDAMEVLGINPVQRLVTPRMLASGLVALLLNSLVVHHRHPGRLRLLGVHPGRQSRRVRRGHHAADRGARGDHLVRQGRACSG